MLMKNLNNTKKKLRNKLSYSKTQPMNNLMIILKIKKSHIKIREI